MLRMLVLAVSVFAAHSIHAHSIECALEAQYRDGDYANAFVLDVGTSRSGRTRIGAIKYFYEIASGGEGYALASDAYFPWGAWGARYRCNLFSSSPFVTGSAEDIAQ